MREQDDASGTTEVRCATCGRRNRVASGRVADAVCGACKTRLSAAAAPVTVTDATFAAEVVQSATPVLVDFWAPWCGPCRAMAPTLDRVAAERAGALKVVKVNVDENPQAAARHGVQAIPTLILYRGGRVIDEMRGAVSKPALDARLARLL